MTRTSGALSTGRLHEADFCSFFDHRDQPSNLCKEKRRSARFSHEEPVILETQEGDLIGAVVMNYGKNGLYFESNLKIHRGAVLRICNESTLSCPESGGCCAEVRWSRRLAATPAEYAYGTGVRYC